jgi:multidrug efflux pump subunit AcrA (membrane-fusion protein)
VPQTAIVLRDGFNYVFTVDGDKIVHRLRVETGRRSGDDVEIQSGLTPDALVVQEGGAFLSDGVSVNVVGG